MSILIKQIYGYWRSYPNIFYKNNKQFNLLKMLVFNSNFLSYIVSRTVCRNGLRMTGARDKRNHKQENDGFHDYEI